MNVVSRVGNLITQGVYSVATPFHPFGGAVDIIVVEQEDGTYRSTPWYVRFGKFQGVLKGAEKIVRISVNGIEADFNMYLDNSGEAYFVREESVNKDMEPSGQVCNSSDLPDSIRDGNETSSVREENDVCNAEEETNASLYGFHAEHPMEGDSVGSTEYAAYHYGSLNDVEDLVKSSQDLNSEMVLVSVDGHVLTAPISSSEQSMENVQLNTPQFHLGPGEGSAEDFTSGGDEWGAGLFGDLDASTPEVGDTLRHPFGVSREDMQLSDHLQESQCTGNIPEESTSPENVGLGKKGNDMFMSCQELSELTSEIKYYDSPSSDPSSVFVNGKDDCENSVDNSLPNFSVTEENETGVDFQVVNGVSSPFLSLDVSCAITSHVRTEIEEVVNGVMIGESSGAWAAHLSSDFPPSDRLLDINMHMESHEKNLVIENSHSSGSVSVSMQSLNMNTEMKCDHMENTQEQFAIKEECSRPEISDTRRSMFCLGFEISLCGNLLCPGMGEKSASEAFEAHRVSKEEFESSASEIVKNENLIVRYKEKYLPWDMAAPFVLGMAVFGVDLSLDPKNFIPVEEEDESQASQDTHAISPSPSSRRWRLWPIPFRRVKTLQHTDSSSSTEDVFVDSDSSLQSPHAEEMASSSGNDNQSSCKQFMRTNIPTTEQIASLKLKDGQNTIAFSFSARVLGNQQVDAHIYLWKWNARIVISDVDGTITKSDVLGQLMPYFGRDWTQSGVARLFSAIKENGYQLLFLSARAIVQAYLTKSFLFNLKQDGKTLPNGPVVISPDGLFPSLYREVIRRAPHEFKIACLKDIRALFPSDYNPFYAGFGNRDTDELSYRKIEIPKGKIFIINPKGEVAINHCIDVKSYTSLHTLVNDMFPPTSVDEQEDFNSWNYWKMPLPSIDC
uniref:phosphatidate phosphatase n=1 Tax=Anthurium amnicola TaxID=1678845 RepID=A0A1D1XDE8_9ARAE